MKVISVNNCTKQQSFGFRSIKLDGITYQDILGKCSTEDWLEFKEEMKAISPMGRDVAVTMGLIANGSNVFAFTTRLDASERPVKTIAIWREDSVEATKENILNGLRELSYLISSKRGLIK